MDYQEIVDRFKRTFEKNGAKEGETPWFGKAAPEELACLTDLYGTFHSRNQVYLQDELESLRNYQVPETVLEFYRDYEPNHIPMTQAGIYMCDLGGILAENSSGAPGGILIRYGLVTLATTIGGMAVCMDLNQVSNQDPKIVLVDLDDCLDPEEVSSYEDVVKIEHLISPTFSEFLWKLSGDLYEDFEDTYCS